MATVCEETDAYFQSVRENRHSWEALENHYDEYASKYHIVNRSGEEINKNAAITLAKEISDKHKAVVLDVPCGTGTTGKYLVENGFQVIHGIDLSQNMLNEAKLKNYYRNLTKDCLGENGLKSCETNSYDAVICIQGIGIGHIEFAHALKEFRRILKPGGTAVYTVNESVSIGDLLDLHKKYFVEKKLELLSMSKRYYLTRHGRDEDCYLCAVKKSAE